MMPETKLTTSHMTAVPAELRRRHGLKPGDTLEWFDFGGRLFLRPRRKRKVKFSELILPEGVDLGGKSDEELLYGDSLL